MRSPKFDIRHLRPLIAYERYIRFCANLRNSIILSYYCQKLEKNVSYSIFMGKVYLTFQNLIYSPSLTVLGKYGHDK
jgi:hypothetical protein